MLGICGTGMASLAGMLKEKGYVVSGSDQNVYPPMSEMLAALGVEVRTPYRGENLPQEVDLVVVGNAISRGNVELEEVLDRRLPYASMAEVVKEVFIRGRRSIVVAGTHGKTTTTSLTAWVLSNAGREPGFLIGGVPDNFGTSYRNSQGEIFVIEGDEYDTAYFDKGPKFLHYLPEVVALGNVEYDHADIYPDLAHVVTAFERLVNLIPRRGLLVVGAESVTAMRCARKSHCPVESFSVANDADWRAKPLESSKSGTRFEVTRKGTLLDVFEGPFWGAAALRNALVTVAVAHWLGLDGNEIGEGLRTFSGVRRRMEVRGECRGIVVVDDFAHHPTAIQETIRGGRLRWPGRRIWAVFEPRSFTSRSNVFQKELSEALSEADRVILAKVYSSSRLSEQRELQEEQLIETVSEGGVEAWFIPEVDEIVDFLASNLTEGDVVLAMSNGGFGGIHQKLLDALE
jgi:UDP-N-acetylmuramate: L-alanyl-gamma-D-glutamyl-meso-diaminopimelate ligase